LNKVVEGEDVAGASVTSGALPAAVLPAPAKEKEVGAVPVVAGCPKGDEVAFEVDAPPKAFEGPPKEKPLPGFDAKGLEGAAGAVDDAPNPVAVGVEVPDELP